jgi:hypothetical protein
MNPLKRMNARMKRGFPVWDGLPYHMCHVLTVADCMINVNRGLINPGPLVIGVAPFKLGGSWVYHSKVYTVAQSSHSFPSKIA